MQKGLKKKIRIRTGKRLPNSIWSSLKAFFLYITFKKKQTAKNDIIFKKYFFDKTVTIVLN